MKLFILIGSIETVLLKEQYVSIAFEKKSARQIHTNGILMRKLIKQGIFSMKNKYFEHETFLKTLPFF